MTTTARRSTRLGEVSDTKAVSESTPVAKSRASSRLQAKSNKPKPTVGANTNTNKKGKNANANNLLRIDADASTGSTSQRPPRERKPRTTYSPTESAAPTRAYRRRAVEVGEGESPDEQCRRLEGRIRSQVKQLRYLQTFLEAYEAEGWRRASREKLKPSKELEVARRKMVKTKRRVVDTLHEILGLKQRDPQIPYLKEIEDQPTDDKGGESAIEEDKDSDATKIYCSRCSLADTTEGNDILLCDNEGCFRAFHQQCQVPAVSTDDIPPGDEPWFCASCLALFNSLKLINYACDSTYEKVEDVFTELTDEEQSLLAGDHGESTAEGTEEEEQEEESDGEDEDDEDFAMDEQVDDDGSTSVSSESDSEMDSGGTSADDGVLESDVSEDELKHLHKDDVIDANRRSTRSKSKASSESWLGRRVAKQSDCDQVVMGVIVEQHEKPDQVERLWRVVYYDDTMGLLDDEAATKAMELAVENEHQADPPTSDKGHEVDRSLIVRGKRKRTRVDYRALNDLLFDGKDDSDVGDDESHDGEADDDEDEPVADGGDAGAGDDEDYTPTSAVSSGEDGAAKRGRRARHKVDYRAMHEGVVSF